MARRSRAKQTPDDLLAAVDAVLEGDPLRERVRAAIRTYFAAGQTAPHRPADVAPEPRRKPVGKKNRKK